MREKERESECERLERKLTSLYCKVQRKSGGFFERVWFVVWKGFCIEGVKQFDYLPWLLHIPAHGGVLVPL